MPNVEYRRAFSAWIYRRLLYPDDVAESESEHFENQTSHNFTFGDYFVLAAVALAFSMVALGVSIGFGILTWARLIP
jgi:hypothetical protein